MTKTIGVIGLGSIGLRHTKNLKAMGHQVIGYDPIQNIAFAPIVPCLDDVITVSDVLVIASPTQDHYAHLLAARDKPCLVEKPIAETMDQLVGLVGRPYPVMVGYNLRFHGCVKKAKEWLDAGRIGDPLWANFTLGQRSIKPPYLRDGVILNFASHEIDMALYLLGPAKVLCATTKTTNSDEMMTDFVLEHDSGCRSSNHTDYITFPEQRYFTITGTKGRIFINVAEFLGSLMVNGEFVDEVHAPKDWNQTYIDEIEAFLARVEGKETFGCSGQEGLKVLKICLEVKKLSGL